MFRTFQINTTDHCFNRPLRDQTQEYGGVGTNGKLVSSRVSDVHQTVHNRSPSDIGNEYPIAIGTDRGKNFSEKLHYGPTVCLAMPRTIIAPRDVDVTSDRNCVGGTVDCIAPYVRVCLTDSRLLGPGYLACRLITVAITPRLRASPVAVNVLSIWKSAVIVGESNALGGTGSR